MVNFLGLLNFRVGVSLANLKIKRVLFVWKKGGGGLQGEL